MLICIKEYGVLQLFQLCKRFITSPGGGCEVLFSPDLPVCVCLSVCVSVNILVFYFSAIRKDIDLKFIQDTYRVVLNLTFICQRSQSGSRALDVALGSRQSCLVFWVLQHVCSQNKTDAILSPLGNYFIDKNKMAAMHNIYFHL